ncbi:MAG: TrbI/VirB10 family protein [Terriglobia bacterium]
MTETSNTPPVERGLIEDKAPRPPGVMSKHTQSLVIMGVAVLMVLIMWLTGNKTKPAAATNPTAALPSMNPTDNAKLQELKQAIQAQQQATRRPVAPPDATQQGWLNAPGMYGNATIPNQTGYYGPPTGQGVGPIPPPGNPEAYQQVQAPPEDPLKEERKKRAYESLFASNVALTYRDGEDAHKFEGAATSSLPLEPPSVPQAIPPASQGLAGEETVLRSLLSQSTPASGPVNLLPNPPAAPVLGKGNPESRGRDAAAEARLHQSVGKNFILFEGAVIETVLMNRLDGSFAGPVMCLVSTDVYSHDRQHVLVPAGTKVLGEAQKVSAFGQDRLAVYFHRLIMPDGYSESLDQFKGLDQQGATALHDKVNNHYVKIFGASLAVGILGGIAEVGTGSVLTASAFDQARQGFGEGLAMSGERVLDRFLNLMPTITIREGARVKIYLSNDLLLPDYANHTMPADM